MSEPFHVRVAYAPTIWPLTTVYMAAIAAMIGVAEDWFNVITAIGGLGLFVLGVLLVTVIKEVRGVHLLVNSQRDDLIARIDQLVAALTEAGVSIPRDPADPNDPSSTPPRKSS